MGKEQSAPDRPKPQTTEISQGFWDGVERGELVVQHCCACGTLRHYPQPMCPSCGSAESDWKQVSGRGSIYSFTVSHRAFHPAWKDHVPYVIATIELDEGVRMICDLLDADPAQVAIGQQVELFFAELPGQGRMPRFRIIDPAAASHV